jgi:hypothetical protein
MPCKKEENKVKPSAQHTLAYVKKTEGCFTATFHSFKIVND